MQKLLSRYAVVVCAFMAISGATMARSATVLSLDVGSLRVGSLDTFAFNEISDDLGVIRPEIFSQGSAVHFSADGDPLDPTQPADYILNFNFTVDGTGTINNYLYPLYVSPQFSNINSAISDGSSILGSGYFLQNISVQPDTSYTFSISFHYSGCCINFGPSTGFEYASDVLEVTPQASEIPEPITWATLVGGLALTGATMRRHYRNLSRQTT